jgi:hypothetical protein
MLFDKQAKKRLVLREKQKNHPSELYAKQTGEATFTWNARH